MAKTGFETIYVHGTSQFEFERNKNKLLAEVQEKLDKEGKEITQIIESEWNSAFFGTVGYQQIKILWRIPDVSAVQTNFTQNNSERAPEKVIEKVTEKVTEKVNVTSDNFNSILERIDLFLEDKEWEKASAYCESALDYAPKNGEVYLRYFLADIKISKLQDLINYKEVFDNNTNYQKAVRFADEKQKKMLDDTVSEIKYQTALSILRSTASNREFSKAISILKSLGDYKDSMELKKEYEKQWILQKNNALDIWEDYLSLNEKSKELSKQKAEVSTSIKELNNEIDKFKGLRKVIYIKSKEITTLEEKNEELQKELILANNELQSIGFFAFSKKREINDKIAKLTEEISYYSNKISKNKNYLNTHRSVEVLSSSIDSLEKSSIEANDRLTSICNELESIKLQILPFLEKLENRQIIAFLSQEKEILPVLIEEISIADIIKEDEELKNIIKNSKAYNELPKDKKESLFRQRSFDLEEAYCQACTAMEEAKTVDDYIWAREEFAALGNYKQSSILLEECDKTIAFLSSTNNNTSDVYIDS